MNTVDGSLILAEYGHAKDNPDLPQINLLVCYNQTNEVLQMHNFLWKLMLKRGLFLAFK